MHVPFRVALPVLLQLGTAAAAADYQAAKDLYDQGEIAKAKAAFSGVLGDHAQSAKNRAAAARGLARIDWLIDGNADAATAQLKRRSRSAPSNATRGSILRGSFVRAAGSPTR